MRREKSPPAGVAFLLEALVDDPQFLSPSLRSLGHKRIIAEYSCIYNELVIGCAYSCRYDEFAKEVASGGTNGNDPGFRWSEPEKEFAQK